MSRDHARALRQHMTDAEDKLWFFLRDRRLLSAKFRRQTRMGRYIVDFVCHEKRLVIEVDGGQHTDRDAYDSQRTAWLNSQGYRVLRFWNPQVLREWPSVLETVMAALAEAEDDTE